MRSGPLLLVLLLCGSTPVSGRPANPSPVIFEQDNAASPIHSTAAGFDTIYYGGTFWKADSMRWEAIRDSVWTFDSGVGSSINTGQNPNKPVGYHQTMEGWFGLDRTLKPKPYFRRSSTCVITGSYSAWAGVSETEAAPLCYAAGAGYGNDWNLYFGKQFTLGSVGNVTLSYQYAVQCEADFDYAYVWVDTTGNPTPNLEYGITAALYTGVTSGSTVVVLHPGAELPTTPGATFTVWFTAYSDGAYSDEDGMNTTTCGHSAFDNISLAGAVVDFTNFETGSNGWAQFVPTTAKGDYSNIADFATLPDPTSGANCTIQDSVLVFFTPSGGTAARLDNLAVSPWIDLKRGGLLNSTNRLMVADMLTYLPLNNYIFIQLAARYYPYVCSVNGVTKMSPFLDQNVLPYFGDSPTCRTRYIRNYSNVIPATAEQVQVAWGVINLCRVAPDIICTMQSNTTPYLDNIRFGVSVPSTAGVPDAEARPQFRLLQASPNPLRGSTRIQFETGAPTRVSLRVFDVAGRSVRTLLDGQFEAGSHGADWNGRDDLGVEVPAGLYFYRLTAGVFTASGRVMVVR